MLAKKKQDKRFCGLHIGGQSVRMSLLKIDADGKRSMVFDAIDVSIGARYVESIADAFRQLTVRHNLKRIPLAVVLDGDYCVTRVSMGTPGEVERDLQQLATRVPRYLSLGPGEKITGGYRHSINKKTEYAVTGVANRRVIEALQRGLRECELELTSIEPTMVAVARALPQLPEIANSEAPVLLADGSGTQWDVGIVQEGRLLLDYRPSAARESDRLGETLCGHMSRLHRFCQRHRQLASSQLDNVYMHGPTDKARSAAMTFKNQSTIRSQLLTPEQLVRETELPENANDSSWVGALAAVLKFELANDSLRAADLLTSVRTKSQKSFAHHLTWSIIPVLAAATILFALFVLSRQAGHDADSVAAEHIRLTGELAEYHALRDEVTQNAQKLSNYESLHGKLVTREFTTTLIERIPRCLPNAIKLTRVQASVDGTIRITGTALSESMIYDVTASLRSLPGVNDVQLEATSPRGDLTSTEMDFSLAIKTGTASETDSNGPSEEV